MSGNDFSRGPYGEIFPPPLVSGVTPEDLNTALLEMIGDEDIVDGISELPVKEQDKFHQMALVYIHQQRLAQVFSDESHTNADMDDLRRAVLRGDSISLRPLGMERQNYRTFAPILQRISDTEWRLGVEGKGRTVVVPGLPSVVLRRARQLYVLWAEQETEL